MAEQDWLMNLQKETQLSTLLETNKFAEKFGLTLTKEDAEILVQERQNELKTQQRVEFGQGVLEKLVFAFSDSPYIYQDNYVDVLGRLQEMFYLYKNESMDQLSDDELIEFMKEKFDGECQGDLDYMEDTCLEKLAKWIRAHNHQFIGQYMEDLDEQ